MKKNNTILILIFSIIATILAVCLFIFFWKVIENKNEHISVVLNTLEEKMKEKEDAMTFAQKITEIKLLQDSIDSHFLDSNKIDRFVDYLEEIGLELGSDVSVESIEILSESENIISVQLSTVGTFQEVMETIAYLENIPYQVDITQIYLNRNMKQENIQTTGKNKVPSVQTWQANVSFNILSLN